MIFSCTKDGRSEDLLVSSKGYPGLLHLILWQLLALQALYELGRVASNHREWLHILCDHAACAHSAAIPNGDACNGGPM